MVSREEALRRVTPHWMEIAAGSLEWRSARYPLAKLMVEELLTPWEAAVRWAPDDPQGRSIRQLSRIARQVLDLIMRDFGEGPNEDPVLEMLVKLKEEGEICVPILYWRRVRERLDHTVIGYEREEAVKVTLTHNGERLPSRSALENLEIVPRKHRW